MYKRITLFTFICLLALAGIAQNKDTYTILLSGASFAEPNNKWFEMGCRALHAIPINRAVSAESIAHKTPILPGGTGSNKVLQLYMKIGGQMSLSTTHITILCSEK
mgnify:CR=1 FL=1